MVGSVGLDTGTLRFTEFSPATQGATLFELFSNASLPSITSLFLIEDMPEGGAPSSLTTAICDRFERLPRAERMRLCPSGLTVEVMQRLSNDSELCPESRELEVTVTDETYLAVVELGAEVVKVRAGGGDGRKICISTYNPLAHSVAGTRTVWKRSRTKAGLEKYSDVYLACLALGPDTPLYVIIGFSTRPMMVQSLTRGCRGCSLLPYAY